MGLFRWVDEKTESLIQRRFKKKYGDDWEDKYDEWADGFDERMEKRLENAAETLGRKLSKLGGDKDAVYRFTGISSERPVTASFIRTSGAGDHEEVMSLAECHTHAKKTRARLDKIVPKHSHDNHAHSRIGYCESSLEAFGEAIAAIEQREREIAERRERERIQSEAARLGITPEQVTEREEAARQASHLAFQRQMDAERQHERELDLYEISYAGTEVNVRGQIVALFREKRRRDKTWGPVYEREVKTCRDYIRMTREDEESSNPRYRRGQHRVFETGLVAIQRAKRRNGIPLDVSEASM